MHIYHTFYFTVRKLSSKIQKKRYIVKQVWIYNYINGQDNGDLKTRNQRRYPVGFSDPE